jgi:hypothetical protein
VGDADDFVLLAVNDEQSAIELLELLFVIKMLLDDTSQASHHSAGDLLDGVKGRDQYQHRHVSVSS